MINIKAIIFDVDGVIIDSVDANVALFQGLLVKAGYPEPSKEDVVKNFHMPAWQTIENLIKSSNKAEIQRIFNMITDPELRRSDLYKFPKELEEILNKLHKEYKLGIATSRIKIGMEYVFGAKEIKHLFDAVVCFEDVVNTKPHPEPLLLATKKLGVDPDQAIYIGDSHTDIDAAKSAGMSSIYLSFKGHKDATQTITIFSDIPTAIEKIIYSM